MTAAFEHFIARHTADLNVTCTFTQASFIPKNKLIFLFDVAMAHVKKALMLNRKYRDTEHPSKSQVADTNFRL